MIKQTISDPSVAPIVKSVQVDLPVEAAFHLFTARVAEWWPLRTHSVGGDSAVACAFEPRVGGRFYEVQKDGTQCEWGVVQAWDPPRRLLLSFYPGHTPEYRTEVEVNFAPESGGTRVTLTHRGWDQTLPEMAARRKGYVRGWTFVLGKFVERSKVAQGDTP